MQVPQRGLIVWVDGVEGVGKTTLIVKLKKRLKILHPDLCRDNGNIECTRFPNDNAFAIPARSFLLSRPNDGGDIFGYIANILSHVENIIMPIVKGGGIVLCDRSILSALALQLNGHPGDSMMILDMLSKRSEVWDFVKHHSLVYLVSGQCDRIHSQLKERGVKNSRDDLSVGDIVSQTMNFRVALHCLNKSAQIGLEIDIDHAFTQILMDIGQWYGTSRRKTRIQSKLADIRDWATALVY